jgi:xylulokinase
MTPTPGIIIFPPYRAIVFHQAPTQSGCTGLVFECRRKAPRTVVRRNCQRRSIGRRAIISSPYKGERAPLWDASSPGVFARIDSRTSLAEMARSVMEGVAYSARLAFEELQKSSDESPSVANIGGGGLIRTHGARSGQTRSA